VIVTEFEVKRGLADSIVSGVTRVAKDEGRVIVLEDGIALVPGWLSYFSSPLDMYGVGYSGQRQCCNHEASVLEGWLVQQSPAIMFGEV
jgi:hypothetical protein